MDYNYLHDRQDHRQHPDSSHQHHHAQHPPHYSHQHYPPAHHALQPGYPGIRFAPCVNPLQGPGPGQPGQGMLPPPRVATSSTGGPSPSGQELENILTTVMQGTSPPLHLRQVLSNNQQRQPVLPPPQQLQPPPPPPPPPPSVTPTHPQTTSAVPIPVGIMRPDRIPPTTAHSQAEETHTVTTLRTVVPRVTVPEPAVQVVEPQVQPKPRERPMQISAMCQTEPPGPPSYEEAPEPPSHPPPPADLPKGLSYIESVGQQNKITGVMADKALEKGERFGPFTGTFVKESLGCLNPSTWEICVRGKAWFYIDGTMEADNWMQWVQCARREEEQNLEAIQYYGDIYFCTTKKIKPGTELRVFYSQAYSDHVGFKTGFKDLDFRKDTNNFECKDCKCRYTKAKSMLRHIKFEHDTENNPPPPTTSKNNKVQKETKKDPKLKKDVKPLKALAVKTDSNKKTEKSTQDAKKPATIKRYTCSTCGKHFPSIGRLAAHESFHEMTKKSKPVCEVCGLECANKSTLTRHMISHKASSHKCDLCSKYYTHKRHLIYHQRHDHKIYFGEKWMRGDIQEKMARFVGPGETEEEQSPFHPELPTDMLGKRILNHSNKPRPFKCKFCSKRFPHHHLAQKHEKEVHTGAGKFKCSYCPVTFMEENRFLLHVRKHTKDRPYKCSQCPRSFASEKALNNHQGEHTGAKPFKCEFCGRGFLTKKYMATHKRRMHLKPEKPWSCKYCNKSFTQKGGMVRHERCHKGIRPHVCLTCGKAFTSKTSLQAHSHIHTGEKPYACTHCDKRFALNHHLTTHMFTHEKQQSPQKSASNK